MAKEDIAVTKFREYLRIKTVQPKPDYAAAKTWLFAYGRELGLRVWDIEIVSGKPFVVFTLDGTDKTLTSVMLYSHIDVVPVFPEHWKYDPFSAHKDENGDIYARGTQDMKSVGIQYCEAIRRLKQQSKPFTGYSRTIHIVFGPDEEIGAFDGMKSLASNARFKELNVGFVLDEGIASPTSTYQVFNAERDIWWLKVTCTGNPGHGSLFIENTAAEKLRRVTNRLLDFREEQRQKMINDKLTKGRVITVNMTIVEGGVQTNVVPDKMSACFDIRIPPTVDLVAFEKQLADWLNACGEQVDWTFTQQSKFSAITDVSDKNPFWQALTAAFRDLKIDWTLDTFFGATDARFIRNLGVPCINFSPMINTPVLLHDHNEFLNENVFLRGIEIYMTIIPKLGQVV